MRIIFLLYLFCGFTVSAQVTLVKSEHNFGEINRGDERLVDFTLRNNSNSAATIFRLEAGEEFDVKFTSKTIAPGDEEIIRLQFNPREKGKFNYKIPLYISAWQKPEFIKISGEVMYVDFVDTPCPDFSNPNKITQTDLFVKVFDQQSMDPVKNAFASIIVLGRLYKEVKFNNDGEHTEILNPDYYLLSIGAKGYHSVDTAVYVSRLQKDFIIPLIPLESNVNEELLSYTEPLVPESQEELELETIELEIPEEAIAEDEAYPHFPLKLYKANNIVFLIDISTSMRYQGRLDLLKYSMIQLLDMLRPIDKIAVVTYASGAEVLLSSVDASDKEAIEEIISTLEAKGSTAGGKGIELAGEVALKAFIENGNNEIILATDGAFNKDSENADKIVKKYNKKGIKLTVVGIKNSKFAAEQMKEISDIGEGNYLEINGVEEARELLKLEIRRMSKKNTSR